MKLLALPDDLRNRRQFHIWDDFIWYISPHMWTSLASDGGVTAPVQAATTTATGGVITMSTGATDNNEVAFATTNKPFLWASEKPVLFETRIQFTEANTSAANVCVGFSSVMNTANMMLDDGAGPAASFSGAVLYKLDGGTVWRLRTSTGTTNTDSVSTTTAGGSSYQTLRIEVRQGSTGASGLEVVAYVDGVQLVDSNNKPIKQYATYTSAVNMQVGNYLKAGSATSETLLTDYVDADGLR